MIGPVNNEAFILNQGQLTSVEFSCLAIYLSPGTHVKFRLPWTPKSANAQVSYVK